MLFMDKYIDYTILLHLLGGMEVTENNENSFI